MKPKVTAYMTVYNEKQWVGRAVDSLLSQTLRDTEILVIDDGSTDGTDQILGSFDDPRLRVITTTRRGRAAALAFATTEARGEYLANLDADDEAFPNRLKEQARFLDAHRDHGWVGSGEAREDTQRHERQVRTYPETDEAVRHQAAKCIPYSHSAVMIRKEVLQAGANYDPEQKYLIDFEFFLRVALRWKVANLPEPLVMRRLRNESYFQSRFSTSRQNLRLAQLCRRAIGQFRLPRSYYLFPVARIIYPLVPNRLKRMVRRRNGLPEVCWREP